MEIERKWVLDAAPDGLAEHRSQRFEQGYLAIDPAGAEVRVRRKDGKTSVMTVKTGRGSGARRRGVGDRELRRAVAADGGAPGAQDALLHPAR